MSRTCETIGEDFCRNDGRCIEDPEGAAFACDCSSSGYFASTEFLFSTEIDGSIAPEIAPCNTHRIAHLLLHAVALGITVITLMAYIYCTKKLKQHRRLVPFYGCSLSFIGYSIVKLIDPEEQLVGEDVAPTMFLALSAIFLNLMMHMFLYKYLHYGSKTSVVRS